MKILDITGRAMTILLEPQHIHGFPISTCFSEVPSIYPYHFQSLS
jgi:hypothetical protein